MENNEKLIEVMYRVRDIIASCEVTHICNVYFDIVTVSRFDIKSYKSEHLLFYHWIMKVGNSLSRQPIPFIWGEPWDCGVLVRLEEIDKFILELKYG